GMFPAGFGYNISPQLTYICRTKEYCLLMEISLNTTVARNTDKYIASQLGDEIVMMDNDNGNFLSVNRVASDIWNLLDMPLTVHVIIDKLAETYDIPYEQCKAETVAFLSASDKHAVFLFS